VEEDKEDDSFLHVHIETMRKGQDLYKLPLQKTDLGDLTEVIDRLCGMDLHVFFRAVYSVSVKELPSRGIASALLAISTKASGTKMRIVGTTMDLEDDLLDRITWQLDDEDAEKMEVTIEGNSESVISDDYLENFVKILREGLDRLIFESPPDKSEHGEPTTKKPMSPKKLSTG
jgi:hypothetical protein